MTATLPNGRVTSSLGVGMATVMRRSAPAARRDLLQAFWDAGYRHFDTAPLYGLGRAEGELGRFLGTERAAFATVATKFGLRPSTVAKAAALMQRPVRAVIARSPAVRRLAKRAIGGNSSAAVAPSLPELEASLSESRRALGQATVDLLLLHEVEWSEEWSDLIGATSGMSTLPTLGLAASEELLATYPHELSLPVLQVEAEPFRSRDWLARYELVVQYAAVSTGLAKFERIREQQPELLRELENRAGLPLRTREQFAGFSVCLALAQHRNSIVLVGTTDGGHAAGIARYVEAHAGEVAAQRAALWELAGGIR